MTHISRMRHHLSHTFVSLLNKSVRQMMTHASFSDEQINKSMRQMMTHASLEKHASSVFSCFCWSAHHWTQRAPSFVSHLCWADLQTYETNDDACTKHASSFVSYFCWSARRRSTAFFRSYVVISSHGNDTLVAELPSRARSKHVIGGCASVTLWCNLYAESSRSNSNYSYMYILPPWPVKLPAMH